GQAGPNCWISDPFHTPNFTCKFYGLCRSGMMGVEAAKFNFNREDVDQNRRIAANIDRRRVANGARGRRAQISTGMYALRKETPY
ncbi:hypothetical protein ACTVMJ_26025, partial [Serratia marcescens]